MFAKFSTFFGYFKNHPKTSSILLLVVVIFISSFLPMPKYRGNYAYSTSERTFQVQNKEEFEERVGFQFGKGEKNYESPAVGAEGEKVILWGHRERNHLTWMCVGHPSTLEIECFKDVRKKMGDFYKTFVKNLFEEVKNFFKKSWQETYSR